MRQEFWDRKEWDPVSETPPLEPSLQIFKGLPKQVALLNPKSLEGQLRACIQPGLGEGEGTGNRGEAFVYVTSLQDGSGLPGL